MHNVSVTRINPDGTEDRTSGSFKDGQIVVAQGDVAFKCRFGMDVSGREVKPLTFFVAAHGESGNTHVMTAVQHNVGLDWLKEASAAPSTLTDFAYGDLAPGTEMLVRVPEGGAQVTHEEHDGFYLETPGIYGVVRQFETRGQTRQNVWD